MKEKEITVQIFTGGYAENRVTSGQIKDKLLPVLEAGPVKRVIMGWSSGKEVYRETIDLLKSYGTECFLWLPVFSETGILKSVSLLKDDEGREVKSFHLKEGENFEFYCPNDRKNIESFLEIYEEYFSDIGFDGVFLDKIRYGAFSNGLSGVFGCFCDQCAGSYKAWGISVQELKSEMACVRNGAERYAKMPLGITAYREGSYEFENAVWNKFFQKKSDDIFRAMTVIVKYFRERNMAVGMDTFSPFTAYFAGQDIARLGKLADFVKPMMYRITHAPAGLPFEAECLIGETAKGADAAENFYKVTGCRKEDGPFDLEFVKREIRTLTGQGVQVSPGIEINRNESADAGPSYIRENLRELGLTDAEGFVLSWDLLSAPDENIAEIVEYMRQRREQDGKHTGNEKHL